VLATVTVAKLAAFIVIVGLSGAIGVWLALRMTRKHGQVPASEPAIGYLRAGLRRSRETRRELLTRGERIVAWSLTLMSMVLAPAGVVILLSGDSSLRVVGITMLVLALFVMAVPISPILQARVRRRQRASRSR
jgi:hypothetical protein